MNQLVTTIRFREYPKQTPSRHGYHNVRADGVVKYGYYDGEEWFEAHSTKGGMSERNSNIKV